MPTYHVDTTKSTITWHGRRRVGPKHHGTILIKSGELSTKDSQLTGGRIVLDMTTITDLSQSGAMKEKLEGHLRSADFFSVEQHPTATFEITNVDKQDGQTTISGPLTMKEIGHDISTPADITIAADTVTLSSDVTIDRSKWDVRFGSGSFFDNLGDNLIEDDVRLSVNLIAVVGD